MGHRQYRRDADDADGAREGDEDGAGFLRPQVVEGQRQRGQQRHRGLAEVLVDALALLLRLKGIGVGGDLSVLEGDDARGVFFREVGVMGDHHDQPVGGDLLQEVHDLDTGVAVQGAGRLVCEQDIGVVDQRAGDGDALHLTA